MAPPSWGTAAAALGRLNVPVHARWRLATFDLLTWVRVESRLSLRPPPTVTQSFPAAAAPCCCAGVNAGAGVIGVAVELAPMLAATAIAAMATTAAAGTIMRIRRIFPLLGAEVTGHVRHEGGKMLRGATSPV